MNEKILIDYEYFQTLIEDINNSKSFINIETYIFANDSAGDNILEALKNAALRGVNVRLLIDGFGSLNSANYIQQHTEKTPMQVKIYNPLFAVFLKSPLRFFFFANLRNHRKSCVIDNQIAYVGSANISEYSEIKTAKPWHDITVRITHVSLNELVFAFDRAWAGIKFKVNLHPMFQKLDNNPYFRLNYTWNKRRNLNKSILERIKNCKSRVCVTNAYLIPRKSLLKALNNAAKRGVDVSITVPENPDVIGISLMMSSFYYSLLKSGVKIYHHQPGVLHTKLLIIDDWYCLGSSNLNYRSFRSDLEVDVNIQTPEAKAVLDNQLEIYRQHSIKVSLEEITHQSLFKKIMIRFLLLFRFFC